jgi:hypothetical protein
MRRTGVSVTVAIAAVAVASLAFAGITGVGKKTLGGRGWATNVTVAFTAPQGYSINGSGYENWLGPLFTNSVTGNQDESNISFDVHPDFTTRSAERAARSKLGNDMGGLPTRQVAAGPIDVPHVIGGRKVGVIKGFFLIRQVTKPQYEGWFEAALAFSLGRGYPIPAADLDTTAPDDDATKTIQGMLPSQWNRRVIEDGLRGISVEGNLAPRKVAARVQPGRVTGRVTDTVGHPVVRLKVVLERRAGSSWSRVTTGVTNGNGEFALRLAGVAKASAVRVSVSLGAVARSGVLKVP